MSSVNSIAQGGRVVKVRRDPAEFCTVNVPSAVERDRYLAALASSGIVTQVDGSEIKFAPADLYAASYIMAAMGNAVALAVIAGIESGLIELPR